MSDDYEILRECRYFLDVVKDFSDEDKFSLEISRTKQIDYHIITDTTEIWKDTGIYYIITSDYDTIETDCTDTAKSVFYDSLNKRDSDERRK